MSMWTQVTVTLTESAADCPTNARMAAHWNRYVEGEYAIGYTSDGDDVEAPRREYADLSRWRTDDGHEIVRLQYRDRWETEGVMRAARALSARYPLIVVDVILEWTGDEVNVERATFTNGRADTDPPLAPKGAETTARIAALAIALHAISRGQDLADTASVAEWWSGADETTREGYRADASEIMTCYPHLAPLDERRDLPPAI